MKRKIISGFLIGSITISGLIQTSCMGKFALLKKLYSWNESASDNKFINNLLFWILNILPVYGIVVIVDAVILNLIEFWTGANPLALQDGQRIEKRMDNGDGGTFLAIATRNKMEVKFDNTPAKDFAIVYQPKTKSWMLETSEKSICIAKELRNNQIALMQPNGSELVVSASFSAKDLPALAWKYYMAKNQDSDQFAAISGN
jgi:hypothetical protein